MAIQTVLDALPRVAGAYGLLFQLPAAVVIQPGRLGAVTLEAGAYLYAGSARGPGGLRARVGRHCRTTDKKPHWHIDALTAVAPVVEVWLVETDERLECVWTAAWRALPGTIGPVPGFGASDCHCQTHLLGVVKPAAAYHAAAVTCSGLRRLTI